MYLQKELESIFKNVNAWLKFAEGKNAALIAFNSAVSLGIIRSLPSLKPLPFALSIYLGYVLSFLGLGAVVSLISFLPRLAIPWSLPKSRVDDSDNLVFFGHIANYTVETYLNALRRSFSHDTAEPSKFEEYYAEQIIINSQISLYKYRCFTIGVWLTLMAFLTPLVLLLRLVIYPSDRRRAR